MKKSRSLIYIFTLFFTYLPLIAKQSISIRNLEINTQLPANTIYRTYQDAQGYMWFATSDGACRYDGNQLLTLRSNVTNPSLLKSNEVLTFANDSCQQLWIGTTNGVNLMDLETYEVSTPKELDQVKGVVNTIVVTSDNQIWIGSRTNLFRYSSDLKTAINYDELFTGSSITAIYEDKENNIWLLTDGAGFYKYNKETDSFKKYPKIGLFDAPFRMLQDKDDTYWICTWGDGVYRFDPAAKEGKEYHHYNINKVDIQEFDCSFSIVQDSFYEYIWVMSLSGVKAFTYNKETDKITHIDVDYLFKSTNNIFSEFTKDKSGNIWIGAYDEGAYLISFDEKVATNISLKQIKTKTNMTPNINVLSQDFSKNIWFNQGRIGLGWYDSHKKQVSFYYEEPDLKSHRKLENVTAIRAIKSRNNEVWIAPRDERLIYRLKKNKSSVNIAGTISLSPYAKSHMNSMYEDKFGNVWLSANLSYPLLIEAGTDTVSNYPYSFGNIVTIKEDQRNHLWIATNNNGVFSIEQEGSGYNNISKIKAITIPDYIKNINCIDIGSTSIWLGTIEGTIYSISKKSGECTEHTNRLGFLNESIQDIVCDNFDNVWIATNRKIIRYTPSLNIYQNYTSDNDAIIVDSFRFRAFFLGESNDLLFGGNKGIVAFKTNEVDIEPQANKVFITDVEVNNKSILGVKNTAKFYPLQNRLTLEPSDKYIEIDFSVMNYNQPKKISYRYKLEGIDENWMYTTATRPFAYYNEIPKGKYTLLVTATDENNVWSSEITKFEIIRKPAFYETNLAYFFYTILSIGVILAFLYRVKRRYQIKNELRFAEIEKENIEQLAQTKLQYFTNISHEFLTPLTIVSCIIDDMEMTNAHNTGQLSIMRTNTNRLRRLLQQVLDFRKVENKRMEVTVKKGDLVQFIHNLCYANFSPLIKRKSINFIFTSSDKTIPGYFDEDKLDKIVYNILSNALKYTPDEGTVHVELRKETVNDSKSLTIQISDTGIGIAKDELKNIFTPFYNNKQKLITDTNGLGLSLTKNLVELMQGTISVESVEGKGSIFTIKLPIDKKAYNTDSIIEEILDETLPISTVNEETNESLNEEDSNKDLKRSTLLLVEDNEELLLIMQNILARRYNVFTAKDGLEALDCIKKNNIDLVISDVMMPNMDGWELCRTIKNDLETSDIPIILLTAKVGSENQIESYNAGANGYISKPFDVELLEARIDNFLAAKRRKQKDFKQNIQLNIETLDSNSMDQEFLKDVVDYIEKNISDINLNVDNLAQDLNLSRSTLYRKIKSLTDQSPVEFIRNIRLKHASAMLINESINISEVAYAVGFSDPKYFSKCFKTEFGLTPSEYAKKA